MSQIMQDRAGLIKKLNVMSRKISDVSTFVLVGNDEHTPGEIYSVVATPDPSTTPQIFADFDFLINRLLCPSDSDSEESENRIMAKYSFDSGITVFMTLCGEDSLPPFAWWVPYMDKNGAAMGQYSPADRRVSDPTTEAPPEETPGEMTDDFDEVPVEEPEPQAPGPVEVEPQEEEQGDIQSAKQAEKPAEHEGGEKELWNFFYGRINMAKHAISGGSVIYASEIICQLRTLLIRMICEKNGITEDYLHSIDLIPDPQRSALLKTYPSKPENTPMITALAAELSIFEELMK